MENVFRLSSTEICPFIEEFNAILGEPWDFRTRVAIPIPDFTLGHPLMMEFGVPITIWQLLFIDEFGRHAIDL